MQPRILVLDDEKLIRWSLNYIFHQAGFDVDLAASTDEALSLARTRSYGLILADLEVCGDQAKTFFPGLVREQAEAKVIIITALPSEQAERELGDFKAFRIMEKPFASEEIRAAVKAALAGPDEKRQA
ncbi:MAG: response regulator [Candidatus Aminicenantes bacterium]|nr:response regulator [Candidatus Aminicenantes bacterium]